MKRDATRGNPPTDPLRLVAGLGNPGRQYERTRHNVGWMVADAFAGSGGWKEKFHGRFLKVGAVTVLKPETFMNRSGRSVQAAAAFFGLSGAEICVVHDDLETPFGTVQLTWGGGHRGQNGVRSVMQALGTGDFWRLRVGVGRPPATRSPGDWILERFAPDEEPHLPAVIALAVRALEDRVDRPEEVTLQR
jgi:peptidyl-tRNA hydrolase, PTH1 family